MANTYNLLILGASYGSLLAAKLLLAGHNVSLVCRQKTAKLINLEGIRVRLPVRGRREPVDIFSRALPGRLSATVPDEADPASYDLVALAMQEPHYVAVELSGLLKRIAGSGRPTMSIMNMPPPPYLERLSRLDPDRLRHCYVDASVWDGFDPAQMTLASPDPQAFRSPEGPSNALQVTLPTNFKVARFEADEPTAILRQIESDIAAARFQTAQGATDLPVKLKVYESPFVPLAKWAMLLTGNYRCVQPEGPRSIREAVHGELKASHDIYEWVCNLCRKVGAADEDLVPFEKYASAAEGLLRPSSAARALYAGATAIERVDLLVQSVAAQHGMRSKDIDRVVALIDRRLEANRSAAEAGQPAAREKVKIAV